MAESTLCVTGLNKSFGGVHAIRDLSFEVRQKLTRHRPATLGQAARRSGMTPAAVSLLLVHLKKGRFRGFDQPTSRDAAA